jgi:hypothetical protein
MVVCARRTEEQHLSGALRCLRHPYWNGLARTGFYVSFERLRKSSDDASTYRSSPNHQKRPAEHFGWIAHFIQLDGPASSKLTRERLGWQSRQPGLIPDLEHSTSYFKA